MYLISTMNNTKKEEAISEVRSLTKKLHLYNSENRYYVKIRIKELVKKFHLTYGDVSTKN